MVDSNHGVFPPDSPDLATWRLKTLKLAIPIMLANITVPLVGVVDTAVMGRMADPVYIGATAIGATIFSSIFWLFGFLRMGAGGQVAQFYGSDEPDEIRDTILRAVLIGFVIGLLLIIVQKPVFWISQQAFTASDQLISLTYEYFSIRIYSAPATLILYALIGALVGLQEMRCVLWVQLVLNLVNIFLNLAFFNIFEWGIKGVAVASVASEYIALVLGGYLVVRSINFKTQELFRASILSPSHLKHLLEINGNLFIRTLCLIAAYYWLTAASSRLGELTLAANTLLIQMLHIMAYSLDGFAHAAESLCGQAFGRRDRKRFVMTVRVCIEWGVLFSVIIGALYLWFSHAILSTMTNLPLVINKAHEYIGWIVLAPLISVWGFLLDGIFIGTTHTRAMRNGMIISLMVFAVSAIIFPAMIGNHGLWAAYYVLMICRAATLGFWYPGILRQFRV